MLDSDAENLESGGPLLADGTWYGSAYLDFVDEASWEAYVDALGLSRDAFCDPAQPRLSR